MLNLSPDASIRPQKLLKQLGHNHYCCIMSVLLGPKKNNCVVRVTAEKTLGRVGRYFFFFFFFFFFFAMAHMLDDKKRLSSWECFRILKVWSSAECSHFGLKIFSKTLTESFTLTQKWGKKHTKNRVIDSETGSSKCAVIRSTQNDRRDYSGTTELYRTESLTVPNSTAIFCDFLIFFFTGRKKN